MEKLKLKAVAKINLCLDIKGLRLDGYHQVEMIMQAIDLHDLIFLTKIKQGIKVDSSQKGLPKGKGNLAYQAAELIFKETAYSGGVDIFIEKNIPVAAGLGGGSSDAATVLKGLNQLMGFGLNKGELRSLARELGADVPFFIEGGTAYAYGKGDQLEQLPDLKKSYLVLVKADIAVSTPFIYQKYDDFNGVINRKASVSSLVEMIKGKKEINWDEGWTNVLEPVTMSIVKDIEIIKNKLEILGAKFTLMSGSGPTVFAIVDNLSQCKYILNNWPRPRDFISTTCTIKQEF